MHPHLSTVVHCTDGSWQCQQLQGPLSTQLCEVFTLCLMPLHHLLLPSPFWGLDAPCPESQSRPQPYPLSLVSRALYCLRAPLDALAPSLLLREHICMSNLNIQKQTVIKSKRNRGEGRRRKTEGEGRQKGMGSCTLQIQACLNSARLETHFF